MNGMLALQATARGCALVVGTIDFEVRTVICPSPNLPNTGHSTPMPAHLDICIPIWSLDNLTLKFFSPSTIVDERP